jgi:hypothetical protein
VIGVRGGKWHGGADLEDIVMWTVRADQNTALAHLIHDPMSFVCGRFAITYEFNSKKQPRSTYIANQRVPLLQLTQPPE